MWTNISLCSELDTKGKKHFGVSGVHTLNLFGNFLKELHSFLDPYSKTYWIKGDQFNMQVQSVS